MSLDNYKSKAWLEKMGWKEGMGLGKNNDGIKKYVGVTKKDDTAGLGVDKFQWDNMWWDNIYKKASKNITPGVVVQEEPEPEPEPEALYYGTFTSKTTADSSDSEGETKIAESDYLKKCEGRLLRKYIPEGKLRRIKHQETKFVNGEDVTPERPAPKKPERKEKKEEKKEEKEKEASKAKEDVSEDSDASEALSSDDAKKSDEVKKSEEVKKRKRDTETSSSEEDEEEKKERKRKRKEKRKAKKLKKEQRKKDSTDTDKKKKKKHKEKDRKKKDKSSKSKETKKHK